MMASEPPSPANKKVGVLFKRSDFLKEWKPRHFSLEAPQLRYCLPENPSRVHKTLDLTMCKIEREGTVPWGGHALHTLVVSKPGAGVSYTLGALRSDEADAWVAALKAAAGNATRAFVRAFQKPQEVDRQDTSREAEAPRPPPPTRPSSSSSSEAPPSERVPAVRKSPPPDSRTPPPPPLAAETTQTTPPEPPPRNLVPLLLPALSYALFRAAPPPLVHLRGLAFLVVLGLLVWRHANGADPPLDLDHLLATALSAVAQNKKAPPPPPS
ncbi:hypothetical protein CTAYLR_006406 [Chrysophaeum taylorii]|uniref:PH domain-containing protein n=1 Tax=Chrysophaeum taylorii TaxID=2483200 RepID=A0AAD7UA49_9STRA|nr:hypothetical protein CTAYLR_006406 [Chrysophaeum taylorii]